MVMKADETTEAVDEQDESSQVALAAQAKAEADAKVDKKAADTAPANSTPDWSVKGPALEAELAELKGQLSKLEADTRSRNLSTLAQKQRDDKISKIESRIDFITDWIEEAGDEATKAKVKTLKSKEDVEAVTAEARQLGATTRAAIGEIAKKMGMGDGEDALLKVASDARFKNVVIFWNGATAKDGDSSFFKDAQAEVHRVYSAYLEEQQELKDKEHKKAVEKAKKDALDGVDALDLGSGKPAGGSSTATFSALSPSKKLAAAYAERRAKNQPIYANER